MLTWEGKDLATYGDVTDAMSRISRIEDEAERKAKAAEFMEMYRAEQPEHADANVGYLCGYFGNMTEMLELFQTRHPIFGGPVEAAKVTPERAFEMGKEMMEAHRV